MKILSEKPLCFELERKEMFEYERMDVNFFHPKFVEADVVLKKSKYYLVKLSRIAKVIKDGPHYRPKFVKDGVVFLQKGDITEGAINFERAKRVTNEFHEQNPNTQAHQGDILIRKIGVGPREAAVVPEEAPPLHIYVSLALIRLKEEHNPQYVEIFLNSSLGRTQTERRNKGIGTPDLHLEDIREIRIPIPPKTVQTEIVRTIMNARKTKKKNAERAKQLRKELESFFLKELGLNYPLEKEEPIFQAKLGERFDPHFHLPKFQRVIDALKEGKFKLGKLKEAVKFSSSRVKTKQHPDRLFKYIQIQNVDGDNHKISSFTPVLGREAPGRAKMLIRKGDILLPTLGGSLRSIAIVPKEFDGQVATSGFAVLRTSLKINRYYVFYYVTTKFAQMQIERFLRGAIMPSVTKSDLGELLIPIPDRKTMKRITNRILETNAAIEKLQEHADYTLGKAKRKIERMILGHEHD